MFVYVSGRRQGKTTAVVNWLLEDPEPRAILVGDHRRKEELLCAIGRRVNYSMDKEWWSQKIIVATRGVHPAGRGHIWREVAIDEAEKVLGIMFALNVDFVTLNGALIAPPDLSTDDYIDGDFVDESNPWNRKEIEDGRRLKPNSIDPERLISHSKDAAYYAITASSTDKNKPTTPSDPSS